MDCDSTFKRAVNRHYIGFDKESNESWCGQFRFIQAADSQFGLIYENIIYRRNKYDFEKTYKDIVEARAQGRVNWTEEMRLCTAAVDQWNRMTPRPRFVVICGDLVNDYPGQNNRKEQIRDFRKVFSKLTPEIPLVLLPGNHDVRNRPTVDSISEYRDEFGDDYFAFWTGGVMFIVINAQYFKDDDKVKHLALEHERWIEERLVEAQQARYKHIIVFQHVPWFLHAPHEPDDPFNIAKEHRLRMLAKFNAAGVRAIFAGHYHRNAGGQYENLEVVVTSALGAQFVINDPRDRAARSGYRVVEVEEDRLTHCYVEIDHKHTDNLSSKQD